MYAYLIITSLYAICLSVVYVKRNRIFKSSSTPVVIEVKQLPEEVKQPPVEEVKQAPVEVEEVVKQAEPEPEEPLKPVVEETKNEDMGFELLTVIPYDKNKKLKKD